MTGRQISEETRRELWTMTTRYNETRRANDLEGVSIREFLKELVAELPDDLAEATP